MKRFFSFLAAAALAVMTAVSPLPVLSADGTTVTQDDIVYTVYNDHAEVTGHKGSIAGGVGVAATVGGVPVTKVGEDAFWNCTEITDVWLPDSVTVINEMAFCGCTALTTAEIGIMKSLVDLVTLPV